MSIAEIDRRVLAAQKVLSDFEEATTEPVKVLVKAHANVIGCPPIFIFFPLLSVASHLMGPKSRVKLNDKWKEPLILWNVEWKKSPALGADS